MKVDYIVVGLGLAGLAFIEELIDSQKSFIVYEDASQTSSLVAGGVYNPVILKRYTSAWQAKEQLAVALPFYEKLEKKFQLKFDTKLPIRKVFKSVEDQNNWFLASDTPKVSDYLVPEISFDSYPSLIANFGFGDVKYGGRIETKKLVATYRSYLQNEHKIRLETFEHQQIKFQQFTVSYKDITAKKIVFCEGYGLHKNIFFNYLPLNEVKGELITIYAPDLKVDFLIKSTLFIFPLGNNNYKVGATFNWDDKTSLPTKEGRNELIEKLQKVINVPYTIIDQTAGIRPTVRDRRPLVGVQPAFPQLAVLNGLGTRGVMIAPTVANNLFNHLEKGASLNKEIDIKRFE